MSKLKKSAALIFLTFILAPLCLSGQISFSPSVDLMSNFTWRGFQLADAAVLQPGADIGIAGTGISFNIWGSWAVTGRDTYSSADEVDFTAVYSRSIGTGSIAAGFIHYQFLNRDTDNNTQEIFLSFTPGIELLNPAITAYYDLNLAEDFYIEFGAETHAGPVHLESALGYNNGQYIKESSLSHLMLRASYPFEFGLISITPSAQFEYILYDDAEEDTRFLFGISISK